MDSKVRPDDSDLIAEREDAPGRGGFSGGADVTRVTGEDKPAGGDEPTLPPRD